MDPSRIVVVLFGLAALARADEIALVRVGDAWRFWPGTAEPSWPVTAWRQADFDDSGWAEGRSGFSRTADEATHLRYDVSYRSVYFRRRFTVADPASVKWLVLRIDYDDGFVAYLNGTEIARAGLSGDPVPFDAYATDHPRGNTVELDVSQARELLVPGTNVLAIQLHASASSPSSMVLVPELLANFQRGPFVQDVTIQGATIEWHTPVPTTGEVECWADDWSGILYFDRRLTNRHVFVLTGLQRGTRYAYRVRSRLADTVAESPLFWFRTSQPAGPVRFLVLGDSGGGWLPQFELADLMAAEEVDLVLHTGDLIYPYYRLPYVDTRLLSVYGPHMRTTPYYFTAGNHELYGTGGVTWMLDTLNLPRNATFGTEHFYSFDVGDVHFVCLFVPTRTRVPELEPYRLELGSAQYQWLTNDLASTTKPWKILFLHSPLFTSSAHRGDDYDGDGQLDRLQLQAILLPVIQRYGVQMVFSGHDHNYERCRPVVGMHQIVTGGGGYTLYAMTQADAASSQFWYRYNYVRVSIQGDTLALEAVDNNGLVFDSMTLQKAPPTRQIWPAHWQTPLIETVPADDGDGNVNGQTFDLVGLGIPAACGKFSNLGQLWVNYDDTYLYLGFKNAMIGNSNDIYLFVESPRLPGVETMAGLGNGTPDPQGQGADGLDFVANLSFTNFRPALVCLLGDEMADGTFPAFRRPGQTLATGQGVFRLDPEFSPVPGARLQQFNQSPQFRDLQRNGSHTEQNADFIEVAIPLVALGGLQPGDVIRVGAVVGEAIDPEAQTRRLDSGFLGYALHGGDWEPTVLEGLAVRLEPPAHGEFRLWISRLGPQQFRLGWSAIVGRSYDLEVAPAINAPFQPLRVPGAPRLPRVATGVWEQLDLDVSRLEPTPAALFFRALQLE